MIVRIEEDILVKRVDTREVKISCAFCTDRFCGPRCAAFDIKTEANSKKQFISCSRMSANTWLIGELVQEVDADVDVDAGVTDVT